MRFVTLTAALFCLSSLAATAQSTDHTSLALSLVNEARVEDGLDPLEMAGHLTEAAEAHAGDMLARNYYSHAGPEGGTVSDRVIEAGGNRWRLHAENIARCEGCRTAGAARIRAFQNGWMQSPGHRQNILRDGLDTFGFGLASGDGDVYAVQVFGGPGTPPGSTAGTPTKPADQDALRMAALEALNGTRENNGQQEFELSEVLNAAAETLAKKAAFTDGQLSLPSDPYSLLPDAAGGWARLSLAAEACGGCGARPVMSDGPYFIKRLHRQDTADFSHFGFAVLANGDGRKIAVAVYGLAGRPG